MSCIFCKIINKEIPSTCVYEDDYVYAFKDIAPVAKHHVLIIPKRHIDSLSVVSDSVEDIEVLGRLQAAVPKIAKDLGVLESGFRVVSNAGVDGMQSVGHLHYHLIAGEKLGWPPFSSLG